MSFGGCYKSGPQIILNEEGSSILPKKNAPTGQLEVQSKSESRSGAGRSGGSARGCRWRVGLLLSIPFGPGVGPRSTPTKISAPPAPPVTTAPTVTLFAVPTGELGHRWCEFIWCANFQWKSPTAWNSYAQQFTTAWSSTSLSIWNTIPGWS